MTGGPNPPRRPMVAVQRLPAGFDPDGHKRRLILLSAIAGAAMFGAALAIVMNSQGA
jgi:hypothetical protein